MHGPALITHICTVSVGHPRFFLGSDSAPHAPTRKSTASPTQPCAAGIYTSPILLPLVAHLLESFSALERLTTFASENGRAFYRILPRTTLVEADDGSVDERTPVTSLRRARRTIENVYIMGEQSVVPFWAGQDLNWEIVQS